MYFIRLAASAAVLILLAACSEGPTNRNTSPTTGKPAPDTAAVRKAAKEFRVHYNQPVNLDSTDFYFQPISVVPLDNPTSSRMLSSGSYESESVGNGIEGTCYNVVFYQKSTLAEHLLLPHSRFVITDIDAAVKPDARWPYLFYTIIKADTNGDGEQDEEDARAFYVSDRSGQHLHQLTPDGTNLTSWQIVPKTGVLLVEVRPDVNKDREFTHADGTYWLRFNLQNLHAAPAPQPTSPLGKQLQQQMLDRQSHITR